MQNYKFLTKLKYSAFHNIQNHKKQHFLSYMSTFSDTNLPIFNWSWIAIILHLLKPTKNSIFWCKITNFSCKFSTFQLTVNSQQQSASFKAKKSLQTLSNFKTHKKHLKPLKSEQLPEITQSQHAQTLHFLRPQNRD